MHIESQMEKLEYISKFVLIKFLLYLTTAATSNAVPAHLGQSKIMQKPDNHPALAIKDEKKSCKILDTRN